MAVTEGYGYVCGGGGGGDSASHSCIDARSKVVPPFHMWLLRSAVNKQPADRQREREWRTTQEDSVGLKLCLYLPFTFH